MNPELKQESSFSIVNTLSIIIVVAYLGDILVWMWYPPTVAPEVLAIINQMMGGLQMAFAAVIGYHIGSSKSSKDAQQATRETLSTLATTAATTASTAAVVAGVVVPPIDSPDDVKAWNEAVAANTRVAFEGYLTKYPTGVRAPDAKARIAALP